MKIGLIARADSTGLGIQSREFYDNIECRALVIDSSRLGRGDVLTPDLAKFKGSEVVVLQPGFRNYGWMQQSVIDRFLDGLDVLFAIETPYDYKIFDDARKRRIKSILQFNYEFLEYPSPLPEPDLFAAPSLWNIDSVPEPKLFLPVPVNTHRFTPKRAKNTFLHIAGRPAAHDRNGTELVLKALLLVKNEINVTIKSQGYVNAPQKLPPNVKLTIDNSNAPNYADNYSGGVLILPRRYGGLCLPINEALAAQMPVITTNISPNNLWLPKEWLVPAVNNHTFLVRKQIDVYEADVLALAKKIDQFCEDKFYGEAVEKAIKWKNDISWDSLRQKYLELFDSVQIRQDQLLKTYRPNSERPKYKREFYSERRQRHDRRKR